MKSFNWKFSLTYFAIILAMPITGLVFQMKWPNNTSQDGIRSPASNDSGSAVSCLKMLDRIIVLKTARASQGLSLFKLLLNRASIKDDLRVVYIQQFKKLNLTAKEVDAFLATVSTNVRTEIEILNIISYLKFSKSRSANHTDKLIEEIATNLNKNTPLPKKIPPELNNYAAFLKHKTKLNFFEKTHHQMNIIKYGGKDSIHKLVPEDVYDDILKLTKRQSRVWRLSFEDRSLACKSKTITKEQELLFSRFALGQSLTAVPIYTSIYYQSQQERFNKLYETDNHMLAGLEVGREFLQSFITVAAVSALYNSSESPLLRAINQKKKMALWGIYAVAGLLDPLFFNKFSDEYEHKAEVFIQKLLANDDYNTAILDLKRNLETELDLVDFTSDLKTAIKNKDDKKKFLSIVENYIFEKPYLKKDGNFDFANIDDSVASKNPMDPKLAQWIENNRDQDQDYEDLMLIMSIFFYEQVEGIIHTGDVGVDRWLHARVWTTGGVFKDVFLANLMYNSMCVFGFWKAMPLIALIHGVNQYFGSKWFVKNRDWFLNTPVNGDDWGHEYFRAVSTTLDELFTVEDYAKWSKFQAIRTNMDTKANHRKRDK